MGQHTKHSQANTQRMIAQRGPAWIRAQIQASFHAVDDRLVREIRAASAKRDGIISDTARTTHFEHWAVTRYFSDRDSGIWYHARNSHKPNVQRWFIAEVRG